MGYFSNSTDGEAYYSAYCAKCIHEHQYRRDGTGGGCAVWFIHGVLNYEECNKPDSPLHILIPRDKATGMNKECTMFYPAPSMGLPFDEVEQRIAEVDDASGGC